MRRAQSISRADIDSSKVPRQTPSDVDSAGGVYALWNSQVSATSKNTHRGLARIALPELEELFVALIGRRDMCGAMACNDPKTWASLSPARLRRLQRANHHKAC